MKHLRHFVRPSLFQLIYPITHACNAGCPFCIHRSYLNEKLAEELSISEIERICARIPSFPWLIITGGEPFVRRDVAEAAVVFHTRCAVSHLTVMTNGMFPDRMSSTLESIFAESDGLSVTLGFSIDAIGEEHDRLRGTRNNYRTMLESIKQAQELRKRQKNLSLKAHTVLSRDNISRFDHITREVSNLGLDLHTFDFVRRSEGNKGHTLRQLSVDEVRETVPKIKEVTRGYGGYGNLSVHSALLRRVSQSVVLQNYDLYAEFMDQKRQVLRCQAPERNLVLGPYGDLGYCEQRDWIANLREHGYSLGSVLETERAKALRDSIHNGECHCFHPCYQMVNVLFRRGAPFRHLVS